MYDYKQVIISLNYLVHNVAEEQVFGNSWALCMYTNRKLNTYFTYITMFLYPFMVFKDHLVWREHFMHLKWGPKRIELIDTYNSFNRERNDIIYVYNTIVELCPT